MNDWDYFWINMAPRCGLDPLFAKAVVIHMNGKISNIKKLITLVSKIFLVIKKI